MTEQIQKLQEFALNPYQRIAMIMRGQSGIGKTTLSNWLAAQMKVGASDICSTSNYFIKEGVYAFERSKQPKNHNRNRKRFNSALKRHVHLVICDNTNLTEYEWTPYQHKAVVHRYSVCFVLFPKINPKSGFFNGERNPRGLDIDTQQRQFMTYDYEFEHNKSSVFRLTLEDLESIT